MLLKVHSVMKLTIHVHVALSILETNKITAYGHAFIEN